MGWGWGWHLSNNMKVYGKYRDEMVGKCSLRNFSRKDKDNFNVGHTMDTGNRVVKAWSRGQVQAKRGLWHEGGHQ